MLFISGLVLGRFGLTCVSEVGDGNCLFRALARQLLGDPNKHMEVSDMFTALSACVFMFRFLYLLLRSEQT